MTENIKTSPLIVPHDAKTGDIVIASDGRKFIATEFKDEHGDTWRNWEPV